MKTIMKTIMKTAIPALFVSGMLMAQPGDWNYNPADFGATAGITIALSFNGTASADVADVIGVFGPLDTIVVNSFGVHLVLCHFLLYPY